MASGAGSRGDAILNIVNNISYRFVYCNTFFDLYKLYLQLSKKCSYPAVRKLSPVSLRIIRQAEYVVHRHIVKPG